MKHATAALSLIAALLATSCATSSPAHRIAHGVAGQEPATTPPVAVPSGVAAPGAGDRRTPSSAHAVVSAFAAAYARYLEGRLPARRLPGLSPSALASIAQTAPPPGRFGTLRLRPVAIELRDGGWTVPYAATLGSRHGTIVATLALARGPDGWRITQITPPDLDQIIATHPPAPTVPPGVRAAALAFTRSYLAYTYGHARAAALTDLARGLRERLTASRPAVPAAVRVLIPRVTGMAFAHPAQRAWLATAHVTDTRNSYTIQTTLAHTGSAWLAVRVTVGD